MRKNSAHLYSNNDIFSFISDFLLVTLFLFLCSSFCLSVAVFIFKYVLHPALLTLIFSLLYLILILFLLLIVKRYLITKSNLVFISTIVFFSIIFKLMIFFVSGNYPQTDDYANMHTFVNNLYTFGIDDKSLTHLYNYNTFLSRAFPFFLPMRYLFGKYDILAVQLTNIIISSAFLIIVYQILKDMVNEKIRRLTIVILALVPTYSWKILNYTHDIPGTFLFLICILFIIHALKSKSVAKTAIIGLLLGCFIFIIRLQRGLDMLILILFGIVIIISLLSGTKQIISKRIIFTLVLFSIIVYFPATITFNRFITAHDYYSSNSGMLGFMARGYSIETGGEYNRIYQQIDEATPSLEKNKTMLSIIISQIIYNPFDALIKLPIYKISKFFLVGYASPVETNLLSIQKNIVSEFARGSRIIFAPFFLMLACIGCIFTLKEKKNDIIFLFLILIPVTACVTIIYLGEVSPRYSFTFYFVLAMLAAIGIDNISEFKIKKRQLLNSISIKKIGLHTIIIILFFLIITFFIKTTSTFMSKNYLLEDMRPSKNKHLTDDIMSPTLKPFEQWITIPSGIFKPDDYVEEDLIKTLPSHKSFTITAYLMAGMPDNPSLIKDYLCNIFVQGELAASFMLSELKK